MTPDANTSPLASVGAVIASPAMRAVDAMVRRLAPSDVTVLIVGETGTGKELVAQALHAASTRASKTLIALNCSALNANLLELELFGHVAGAFTGADRLRTGIVESAMRSTLFLDEIGELPRETQTRLLRVLDTRRVRRVGGNEERAVDVRFVVATNRDLVEACNKGRFRPDLYYRLAVATVHVPPLRARPEDVLPLAEYFVAAQRPEGPPQLAPEAKSMLQQHVWPGNVRELRSVMQHLAVVCRDVISGRAVAQRLRGASITRPTAVVPLATARASLAKLAEHQRNVEAGLVSDALQVSQGNQTAAARHLGMSPAAYAGAAKVQQQRGAGMSEKNSMIPWVMRGGAGAQPLRRLADTPTMAGLVLNMRGDLAPFEVCA